MKIYRVAETKKKKENAYVEVDEIDLSEETSSWTSKKQIEEINITEELCERQALIRIVHSEKDIIALFGGLIKGWQEKLEDYEKLENENKKLRNKLGDLWKIRMYTNDVLRYAKKEGFRKFEIEKLESIISEVDTIRSK